MKPVRAVVLLALAVLTGACALTPPIADAPTRSPAPWYAAEQIERFADVDVLWGGTIVDSRAYEDHSELEIVAYPLDSQQRPIYDAPEQGRFIALRNGFLDPAEFAPSRYVTVRGPIRGSREATLRGRASTLAEVQANELLLWPRDYQFQRTRVSVSIGVRAGF